MGRRKEEVVESQDREHDRQQARPNSAEPDTEHDGQKKQGDDGVGLPMALQKVREDDSHSNRNDRRRVTQSRRRIAPPEGIKHWPTPSAKSGGAPGGTPQPCGSIYSLDLTGWCAFRCLAGNP